MHLTPGDKTFSMEFDGQALYNTPKTNMEIDFKVKEEIKETAPLKVVSLQGDYKTGAHPPTLADLLEAISEQADRVHRARKGSRAAAEVREDQGSPA